MTNNPKILTFDIESNLLHFKAFNTGEQYLNHTQLIPGKSRYSIICIAYRWLDGSGGIIKWGSKTGQKGIIERFDKIAEQADIIIGKNSDRFDIKMINGIRALNGIKGNPTWALCSDDIEKQMRKYFKLPSQSLDYISYQLGLGGKIKMEFKHWNQVDNYITLLDLKERGMSKESLEIYSSYMFERSFSTVLKEGKKAFEEMCIYCEKDTEDTRSLWLKLSEHFDSKFNNAKFQGVPLACKHADCGSLALFKDGKKKLVNGSLYQKYSCVECRRYAGKTLISQTTGKEGGIR